MSAARSRTRKSAPSGEDAAARARGRATARRLPRLPRPGLVLAVVVLVVTAFLYARPISSYVETRDQLAARQAEVVALRDEKARLDARLERAASLEVLARDARRIGRVRPGEQLFIVKGVDAWRKAHADAAR